MKDEEIKLESIEVSHTLGGSVEVNRGEGEERVRRTKGNMRGDQFVFLRWRKHRMCGFQSLWTFPLCLPYLFLVSFVHVVPHRFYLFPSYFFLCVLTKWHMLSVYF